MRRQPGYRRTGAGEAGRGPAACRNLEGPGGVRHGAARPPRTLYGASVFSEGDRGGGEGPEPGDSLPFPGGGVGNGISERRDENDPGGVPCGVRNAGGPAGGAGSLRVARPGRSGRGGFLPDDHRP
ncbi:hypothetical protein SDC9_175464 [bioreactor metagenome]|uniref:Uncharacterized protein n=1 Tax=bioreactor metagenome TaxID=1076179 RepID=A0A645GMB4_9ZZZZ